jgi:hypothetical protein
MSARISSDDFSRNLVSVVYEIGGRDVVLVDLKNSKIIRLSLLMIVTYAFSVAELGIPE